jgi:hypothetical protein
LVENIIPDTTLNGMLLDPSVSPTINEKGHSKQLVLIRLCAGKIIYFKHFQLEPSIFEYTKKEMVEIERRCDVK